MNLNLLKNKKYLKYIILFYVLCFLFSGFIFAREIQAENYKNYGLDETLNTTSGPNGETTKLGDVLKKNKLLPERIGTIIGAGLAFIGVLFFILMIYGGFLWMTAQGNEQQVDKAKSLIISAVIGIIIVMAAYAITAYIGGTLTSAPAA